MSDAAERVQRWGWIDQTDEQGYRRQGLIEDREGPWVRHDAHAAAVAELEAEIKRLTEIIDDAKIRLASRLDEINEGVEREGRARAALASAREEREADRARLELLEVVVEAARVLYDGRKSVPIDPQGIFEIKAQWVDLGKALARLPETPR